MSYEMSPQSEFLTSSIQVLQAVQSVQTGILTAKIRSNRPAGAFGGIPDFHGGHKKVIHEVCKDVEKAIHELRETAD